MCFTAVSPPLERLLAHSRRSTGKAGLRSDPLQRCHPPPCATPDSYFHSSHSRGAPLALFRMAPPVPVLLRFLRCTIANAEGPPCARARPPALPTPPAGAPPGRGPLPAGLQRDECSTRRPLWGPQTARRQANPAWKIRRWKARRLMRGPLPAAAAARGAAGGGGPDRKREPAPRPPLPRAFPGSRGTARARARAQQVERAGAPVFGAFLCALLASAGLHLPLREMGGTVG